MSRSSHGQTRKASILLLVVAAVLLFSMGGAIVLAPVTIPLMWMAARRHPSRAFRVAATTLSGLTAAELGWAATYLVADEAQPWIWLTPAVVGVTAAITVWRTSSN